MTVRVAILGFGGNSLDILDTMLALNAAGAAYECVGFYDDNQARRDRTYLGVPVRGALVEAAARNDCRFASAIGSERNFWRKPQIFAATGIDSTRFETLVHPTASVSPSARLGRGVVIFQHVTLTSNVRLGDHVVVLPQTVLSHDDEIGDHTCIAGGVSVSGDVRVGRACYLGTGACIRGGVTIGDEALVGMGAVVIGDVPARTVVVGCPARPRRPTY